MAVILISSKFFVRKTCYEHCTRKYSVHIVPQNKEAVQPELNLFAVQMVSRPLYFAIHINLSDALVFLWKKACKILNKILYVEKAIAWKD